MLIDWFTVAAQIVNFIILALLLRLFLYKPVLKAITQRKQKIAGELADADAIREEALGMKALYEERYRELEAERSRLLSEAREEAESEKAWRMEEARKEAEESRNRLIRTFRDEQQSIHNQITQRARQEVFAIAQKALADLASRELETYIIEEFLRHLQNPDPLEQQRLRQTLDADNSNLITVRSAFSPDAARQKSISKALARALDLDKIAPAFEIAPELICGIEIQINHYKLEWHIAGYLQEMESKESL